MRPHGKKERTQPNRKVDSGALPQSGLTPHKQECFFTECLQKGCEIHLLQKSHIGKGSQCCIALEYFVQNQCLPVATMELEQKHRKNPGLRGKKIPLQVLAHTQ